MARQKNIQLSATVANIICYISQGQALLRSKPSKVKQSDATKASARLFGQGVAIATPIRQGLMPLLVPAMNRPLMYRLNEAVAQWLRNMPPGTGGTASIAALNGFALNSSCSFTQQFKHPVSISTTGNNKVLLSLPAIASVKTIAAPAGTQVVQLQAAALLVEVKTRTLLTTQLQQTLLPYKEEPWPGQQWVFDTGTQPGCISLLALGLRYGLTGMPAGTYTQQPGWIPADICYAEWGGDGAVTKPNDMD